LTEVVGEYLDRLVTVEMRRLREPLRGITRPIYEAILRKQRKPATTLAADRLLEALQDGDYMFCTTGSGMPPWMPKGEVDGPPGLASVARALHLGRGVFPVFVVAENHRDVMQATLDGMGMNVLSQEMAETRYWPAAIVEVMPFSSTDTTAWTKALFARYRPKAVIASEKLGPNEHGITHSATGMQRPPEWIIDAAQLFAEAEAHGLPRISIGDVGNELGYGIVHDEVAEIIPGLGRRCVCPCQGSIVSAVGCDVLIHAANADWGSYALAAAIAFLLRDSRLLVPPDLHQRALDACVAAGATGQFGHGAHVGGTGPETQLGFVALMRQLVDLALSERGKRPF
jgi:hypothetical protein